MVTPVQLKMKDDSIMLEDKFPKTALIGTSVTDIARVKSQCESRVRFSGRTEKVKLNRVLHVPNVTYKLVSVSSLCDNCHTLLFAEKKCVAKC